MFNHTGKIIGFIVGAAGFLFLFKIFFLANVAPSDELAPGIVLIAAILSGVLFAFIGNKTQKYLTKKRN